MKFRPLHDRVVSERIDAEAKTAGGIIIPDTAQEKPQQGQVIAIGPGGRDESGKLIPIDVKVGNLPPEIQGAKVMSLLFQPSPPLFQPSPPPCASCGITTVIAPAFEKGQRIFAIRCPACGHSATYSLNYS